jgi:hypothetical protein
MNKKLLLSLSVLCAGTPHGSSAAFSFGQFAVSAGSYLAGVFAGAIPAFSGHKVLHRKNKSTVTAAASNGALIGALTPLFVYRGNVLASVVIPLVAQKCVGALSPWWYVGMGIGGGVMNFVGVRVGERKNEDGNEKSAKEKWAIINATALIPVLPYVVAFAIYYGCCK